MLQHKSGPRVYLQSVTWQNKAVMSDRFQDKCDDIEQWTITTHSPKWSLQQHLRLTPWAPYLWLCDSMFAHLPQQQWRIYCFTNGQSFLKSWRKKKTYPIKMSFGPAGAFLVKKRSFDWVVTGSPHLLKQPLKMTRLVQMNTFHCQRPKKEKKTGLIVSSY